MISKIHVYNDKFYYKNIEYDQNTVDILMKKLRKRRKIILYCEPIFIKKYSYPEIKIEKYIENKINDDFQNKSGFLFHYEIDKNNKEVLIYSLRNDKFKKLYSDALELSIEPIQFKVKNRIVKKYNKNKSIFIIYKIKKLYSLLFIENSLIIDCICHEKFSEIKSYIDNNRNKESVLVLDKYIKEDEEIENIEINYFIDLGVGI